jgi:hypothetical protein
MKILRLSCRRCKLAGRPHKKPFYHFRREAKHADTNYGRSKQCKTCDAELQREYDRRHRIEAKEALKGIRKQIRETLGARITPFDGGML